MKKLDLIILNLLHDNRIKIKLILEEDFEEIFNVNIDFNQSEREESLEFLQKEKLISSEEAYLLGLTKKGGELWESLFSVNCDLYFEFFTYTKPNN